MARILVLTRADINRCPYHIMVIEHYRDDHTCLCFPDSEDHIVRGEN